MSQNDFCHCTMRYAMSIDILEVHKSKNSLHAHFMLKSIHSFFIWCITTKILTLYQNFKKMRIFEGLLWKNWRGGLRRLKFWSLAIYIIYNKKVQNSAFLSAAFMVKIGLKSEKWFFFCYFFQFLIKGFKQNSIN